MKRSLYINSHCTLQRDQNTLLLERWKTARNATCPSKACANCTSSAK
jgi:hypothetical protein